MNECIEQKKNLGLSRCVKIPQMPRSMITTPVNFKFEAADLVDEATFKAAVEAAISAGVADRIYLWPPFSGFENASEAAVYEENAHGSMLVRNGRYRFRFQITQDLCVHVSMSTHRSTSGRAFLLDSDDNMIGTSDPDGNFYGQTYSLLNPENLILSDGSVATKSPVYIVFTNPNELNKNGMMIPAGFINTIDRLTDATVTLSTPAATATKIYVKVVTTCDGFPLEGLQPADFKVLTTAGVDQPVTTAPYVGDGVYELNGTFVSGTANLVPPDQLSVKSYESTTPVTVTIP